MSSHTKHLDTRVIHAAQPPDPQTGAVMPPIHLSTTFVQDGPGQHRGFEYGRTANPTRQMLERCVAELEGAEHGLAFASGCAAASTLLQTLAPGDHLVACDDVYGGTYRLVQDVFVSHGIRVSWVDMTDPERVSAVLTDDTRMLWIETPTNPLLKIVDIQALASRVRGREISVVVDNTFATPVLQQPLALGADVVLHSSTKYLNGHSDVVGGVVLTNRAALAERLRFLQNAVGAVPSPFDCFLVLRGIKTLVVRMQRHCDSALSLARWLETREEVSRVVYPGLPSHAQHELCARQMSAPGGMVSFELRGGREAAERLLRATRVLVCAESLGGVESLIEHPASMTHAAVPAATRAALGISDGLIRVSVGLEAEADLEADLAQAFES